MLRPVPGKSPSKNPGTPGCGRRRFAGSPPEPSEILGGFPSDSCGARLGPRPPRSGRIFFDRLLAGAGRRRLREVLDPLGGAPLGPVVLHRVEQLAEEAR